MTQNQRRIRPVSEWKRLVQAFESRTISGFAWCQMHQVCYSSIKRWQKTLSVKDDDNGVAGAVAQLDFIPVQLEASPPVSAPCKFDVALKGGHSLHVQDVSWNDVQALVLQAVRS